MCSSLFTLVSTWGVPVITTWYWIRNLFCKVPPTPDILFDLRLTLCNLRNKWTSPPGFLKDAVLALEEIWTEMAYVQIFYSVYDPLSRLTFRGKFTGHRWVYDALITLPMSIQGLWRMMIAHAHHELMKGSMWLLFTCIMSVFMYMYV